jgi:Do/DeqQ family serine protease
MARQSRTTSVARCTAASAIPLFLLALAVPAPAWAGALPQASQTTVAPVVSAVTPGVVSITTGGAAKAGNPRMRDPAPGEEFDSPEGPPRREMGSAGSGVIVDAERGYVLTNAHVVKGANLIEVTTRDKRRFKAELVGHDPETDLAVLRIKVEQLTAVPLGDSDKVQVGDFVLAIGNPYGLGQTVTSGIVSALGRTGVGAGAGYEDFIQTDASINPGNSGGGLVTLDGRLIGINTAIFSRTGGNVGIGFAIPINMAKSVIEQIVAHREVSRGRIGVLVQDVTPELAQTLGVEGRGAIVSALEPGSPAEMAGLTKGDVVTAIDSTPIRDATHLRNLVGLKRAGTVIEVTSWRKGTPAKTVSVRIEPVSTASTARRRRSTSPG